MSSLKYNAFMKKYRIVCIIDHKGKQKKKVEYRDTPELADLVFSDFTMSKDKGEISVFLAENTFGDRYRIFKNKILINK